MKKTVPTEAVGVICKVGDRFQVVEYSEISEQTARRKKSDNSDVEPELFPLEFLQTLRPQGYIKFFIFFQKENLFIKDFHLMSSKLKKMRM